MLERANGDVVGIEVKASATPRTGDASGLALLRDAIDKRFRLGLVLHTGPDTVPLGDRVWAAPLAALWN